MTNSDEGTEVVELEAGGVRFAAFPITEDEAEGIMVALTRVQRSGRGDVDGQLLVIMATFLEHKIPDPNHCNELDLAMITGRVTVRQILEAIVDASKDGRVPAKPRKAVSARRRSAAK